MEKYVACKKGGNMNKTQRDILDLTAKLEYVIRKQKKSEMDLKTEYCGQLKKGDFIIVSQGNKSYLGFYLGRGQGESVQFYGLSNLCRWWDNKNDPNYNSKLGTPYKWYINSPHPGRVSKYSSELLNDEWEEKYNKALTAFNFLNGKS